MSEYAERMSIAKGSPIRAMAKLMSDPELISFAGGNPAPEAFPIGDLSELSKQVLLEKGTRILQYGETEGLPEFKESALERIIRPRGVKAEPGNLLTLTGSVQGFDLLSKVFIDKGDVVLAESASFMGALQAFQLMQCRLAGVEMDDEGVIIEDLEKKMAELHPKIFYCIPTFQNPTGKTLSAGRREKIAKLAAKYDVIVLEDDPYCDLRYSGKAEPPIKTFDEAGKVVLFNSFSKILAPGLRLGLVVAEEEIIMRMALCKQSAVGFPNGLAEAMADAYLRKDLLPAQIKRIVPIYGERCAAMAEGIRKYFPEGCRFVLPDGGMFIWVEMPRDPEKYDMQAMQLRALEEIKVAFIPGTSFSTIPGRYKNTLRLNFSAAPREKIDLGLKKLGGMLKEYV